MSFDGRKSINPDVGLGVVGTKTDTNSSFFGAWFVTSPRALVAIKPIAQIPLRGYSIKQALSKLLFF